ncbi:DNA adenine methylase [Pararhizobium sp.]|uniref:DNA adenine methylase n=1 Tax=Pararhizobium sp. TaxID=1977563 RepID=UPI003D105D50
MNRPPLRYFGGKWRLAPWIISNMPVHRKYVEPFGGGAAVLMQKPRVYAEVYNDIDNEVVNVFRVMRNEKAARRLTSLLELTPFAESEYATVSVDHPDASPAERARRTIARTFMSHRAGTNPKWPAFRHVCAANKPTATEWSEYPQHIKQFCQRLQGVVITSRGALEIISRHDSADALMYIDPPYPLSDRKDPSHGYKHEMNDDDHTELAQLLHDVQAMVMVSGYPGMYEELYEDWTCISQKSRTSATSVNGEYGREMLWMSPNAVRQPNLWEDE